MAELSGFRRFSYQGNRRQSNVPRKSIVSIATTIPPYGHTWIHILRSMYKQTYSLCTGQCLKYCNSTFINTSWHSEILSSLFWLKLKHSPKNLKISTKNLFISMIKLVCADIIKVTGIWFAGEFCSYNNNQIPFWWQTKFRIWFAGD